MVTFNGAGLFMAPLPTCPVHGQMSARTVYARDYSRPGEVGLSACDAWWICHGFDGEGCPHQVRAAVLDWQYLGQAGAVTLEVGAQAMATPSWIAEHVATVTAPLSRPNIQAAFGQDEAL